MNIDEFSNNIGIAKNTLIRLSKRSYKCYLSYYKEKKDGNFRNILAPNVELKGIQSYILRNILENQPVHDCAHGFIKRRSIRTNARKHLGNQYFLGVDIENFFPSISSNKVHDIFFEIVKDNDLANVLTGLCCFLGKLPQGGVTSPMLSNLVFKDLDDKILKACMKTRVIYTRYADDLTFSSKDRSRLKEILTEVEGLLNAESFLLNHKKTHYMSGRGRIRVTGLILNSKKLSIGRTTKKNLRAAIFQLINGTIKPEKINQTIGLLSFLKDIEPEKYQKIMNQIEKVNAEKNNA